LIGLKFFHSKAASATTVIFSLLSLKMRGSQCH